MTVNEKFQAALRHHQAGSFQPAGSLYAEILKDHPDYIPALHLLGVLFLQLGDLDSAIAHMKKALSLNPNNPEAYNHLGSALKAKGQIDEAITCHRQAVQLNPFFAEAHYNLGNAYVEKGLKDEAITHYRKAIECNPAFFQAYFNLGKTFQDQDKLDDAIFCYQKTVEINPDSAEAYDALGILFQAKDLPEEAIAHYQKAIELNPNFAGAYGNMGKAFQEKGFPDKALICYRKALELNTDHAVLGSIYNNIGVVYQEKGQFDDAIACYQKALQIDPTLAGIYKNLGTVFHDLGLFEEAMAYYQKALAISPDDAEIYSNLGSVSEDNGQLDRALTLYHKALQINPCFADAHWNIALTQLKSGNFKEGWKKYEWRFLRKGARPSAFPQPRWDGSSLKGKALLVCAEQGVGDEIMFASCLPDVIAEADSCFVECDKRLIPLFARSFPKAQFVERINAGIPHPTQIPAADMRIAIGSLPHFLRPALSYFSQLQTYLLPDRQKLEMWRKQFADLGTGLKIGISWRGGSKPGVKLARSTALSQWYSLCSVPGIHFINLQYGDCSGELMEATDTLGITIHEWEDANPLKDLDSAAAQIAALDLVISVDNATVHMAGALGVPVFALLPFACDWRWMNEYEDTPWYKTVRLFRQDSPGNWDGVFKRVEGALMRYIERGIFPEISDSYKRSVQSDNTMYRPRVPVPDTSSGKTLRCAIITPVGPGHDMLYQECLMSIKDSFTKKKGIFSEILPIKIDDFEGNLGRSKARNIGIRQAAQQGAEWIFFLDADDLMAPSAFEHVSPYLDLYDAIWGCIWSVEKGETTARERPEQLPFLYSIEDVLSCDPFESLQMGHFVKTSVALGALFNEHLDAGEDFDYYLKVWEKYQCIKIPLPFFYNRRYLHSQGPRSATGIEWRKQVTEIMSEYLQKDTIGENLRAAEERNIISLLCPTRGRPDLVLRLIRSVTETARYPERLEMLFYVDLDDDSLQGYQELFNGIKYNDGFHLLRCEAIWGEPIGVSKSWNILAKNCKGAVLALSNDDQVYIDRDWDIVIDEEKKKFPDEIYCMWFNDGINGPNLCAFPIVSRKWLKTLGYFTPDIFEYFYVDTWIMDIAKRIGRLHYIPHVLVKHMHFTEGISAFDNTYKRNRPNGRLSRDRLLFENTGQLRQTEALKLMSSIEEFKKRPLTNSPLPLDSARNKLQEDGSAGSP